MKPTILLLTLLFAFTHAQLDLTSDKRLDFDDNIAEETLSNEQVFTDAVPANPILNDGKPFYVARDPATGNLDFTVKKTAGIQNDIPVSRKDELTGSSKGHDIGSIGHTFHDYLNIPVKYSSSKFVYPLISNSYSNLKYQGNNKNQVSNHKNYTTSAERATTTMSPKYFTHIIHSISTQDTSTTSTTSTTTQKPKTSTTQRPTTSSTQKPATITTTTVKSTEHPSTVKYSSTIIQSSQFPTTQLKKYVDSSETRKKITFMTTKSTTSAPLPKTTITTQHQASTMPANPVKFLDDLLETVERKETKATTFRPQENRLSFATSMPLKPSAFRPMPTEAPRNQSHNKIVFETEPNPAVMTLSEILNSITGNDEKNDYYNGADSMQVEVKRPLPLSTLATTTPYPTTVQHKTLQQQMQELPAPQHVNLPVYHPIGFPNDDQFEDYVEFENPKDQNQYVRYEVQKPNVNLVKFQQHPLPSMNNVVISPGQNSASFVLGSQQNVGSIGVGSSMGVGTSHFADNNGPVKMGHVINDDPPVRPQTASIRFPSDNNFDNAPIIKGTFKPDDSVEPPQALAQNQPQPVSQQPLVFPSIESNVMHAELSVGMPAPLHQTNPSKVIFENVNDIYEKVNEKKQKLDEVATNDLAPPVVLTPPSPLQRNQFNRQNLNQRRPQNPNILPQFRPNQRVSQGHPQFYKDVGSVRIPFRPYPQQAVPKVGLPPMNPNMRRPPPQFIANRPYQRPPFLPPDQNIDSGNRRVFKIPPPSSQQFPIADRYMKPPPVQQPPLYYLNRPAPASSIPETMQMQQRPYQDVELNKSLPPSPALQFNATRSESERLEPVVTLQMLQHVKKIGNHLNLQSVPHEVSQDLQSLPKNHKPDVLQRDPSVYVVYPVSSGNSVQQIEDSAAFKGSSEEVPLPSKNDYQNTPFTVVSHFEQEPLLMKKDKKKQQFPYQIERPQPPADMRNDKYPVNYGAQTQIYNIGEQPSHMPISSKLTRVTEKPGAIAIAYTPTEPSRVSPVMSYYQHYPNPHHLVNKFSLPNYAGPVISEILDDKHAGYFHQLHATDEGDFHKEHYDFEAPFHASISLNPEVTNPYEGWSIVTKSPSEANKIDRSDNNVADSSEEATTTKKFDPNEFQPVYESGFQPIYSSNRVSLAPELRIDSSEFPSTLSLSTLTSTITTEVTPKFSSTESKSSEESSTTHRALPEENKKKKKDKIEIDSLEAFFESLTRDYDEDEEGANKSENESRSL